MATENDKVNTGALATLVAVGTAAMIGISLAVNALVRHEVGTIGALRDEVGADAYRTLKTEQQAKLEAPAAWSDRARGHVSIPIEQAMKLVITDLKRSPWNATPALPQDAGADAAVEVADAGADAAVEAADAGSNAAVAPDAGAAPEPRTPAPLSPSAAPPAPKAPGAPAPMAPAPAPTAPAPAPAPPAPPTPPATP